MVVVGLAGGDRGRQLSVAGVADFWEAYHDVDNFDLPRSRQPDADAASKPDGNGTVVGGKDVQKITADTRDGCIVGLG